MQPVHTIRVLLLWLSAGLLSALLTVLACFPASWLAPLVETQFGGRISLGDAQGSLWQGSAFIGAAASASDAITPLLPGRFSWQLSPRLLLGQVVLSLRNPQALLQPLHLSGNWWQWQLEHGAIALPAARLAALGAPLNTLQPNGDMLLGWDNLQLSRQDNGIHINGLMTLDLLQMSSRLSAIDPLGNYRMTFAWHHQQADVSLTTSSGSLLLDGHGQLINGHLRFSGSAQAAQGQEENLANLLNLLGQRRQQNNGKTVIELEIT